MTIRILIADDHPLVLDGLEKLFELEDDVEVVARCASGSEVLAAIRRTHPDVALLDIRMPEKSGLEVTRELRNEKIDVRIVILTASLAEEEVLEALRLGVQGVVLKEMAPRLLLQCIRKVHAGERWIEMASMQRALEKALQREASAEQLQQRLTARELQIVKMVAEGLRNKEIANNLGITEGTVKMYLHAIYEKLEVAGRVELTMYARDHELV